MGVVKEIEHRWEDLGRKLRGVQLSKLREIKRQYQSDHMRMEAVVDEYIKYIPTPDWKDVVIALQRMELHKLADEVTTKYVKGMDGRSGYMFVFELIYIPGLPQLMYMDRLR